MKLSTRNQLKGIISSVKEGAVNSEVALALPNGTVIVSVITNGAVKSLGLKAGTPAYAFIKSSNVIIGLGVQQISARNILPGKIASVSEGAVNDEVIVDLGGGNSIVSVITKTSVENMQLIGGKDVVAIIKASSVILGVD